MIKNFLSKRILIIIISLLILLLILIGSSIGTRDSFIKNYLGSITPENVKVLLKETIFVHQNQKLLKNRILLLEDQVTNERNKVRDVYAPLNELAFIHFNQTQELEFLPKLKDDQDLKLEYKIEDIYRLKLEKYTFPYFEYIGRRAYYDIDEKFLYLMSGNGNLFYTNLDNIDRKNFKFKSIKSNLIDYLGLERIKSSPVSVVRHFKIVNQKILLSVIKKSSENCYTNALLIADFDQNFLNFTELFDMKECQTIDGANQIGGVIAEHSSNKIFFTIGDHKSYELLIHKDTQNIDSLVGKIIKIDINNGDYELVSMGHRNPAGIFYDKENKALYSTEHGPQGGDEVNLNLNPNSSETIENFGWAISSGGEHYGWPDLNEGIKKIYDFAPLNKSHSDFGFIEPLQNYTPSIAISEIIKENNFLKFDNKDVLFVASMGNDIEEGDNSLHILILEENKVEKKYILPIGERVRDLVYISKNNLILLFLESSGSIGVLNLIE